MSVLTVQTMQHPQDSAELRYAVITGEQHQGHVQAGPPLVFVPGLGGSVKNGLWFLKHYADELGPVFALDTRGFGLNDHLAPMPHPESYFKDFQPFLGRLEAEGRFDHAAPVFMGISLGAVLGAVYTARFSHPFQARIFLAPAFKPHPKLFTTPFKIRNYGQVLFKGFKAKTTLPYGIRDLTRNPEAYEDPHYQDPLVMPTFYLYLVDRLCRKSSGCLASVDLPTAVVVPEQDRICDPEAMRTCLKGVFCTHQQVFSYPEMFHDVLMEPEADQVRMYEDLKNWLNGLALRQMMAPVG